MLPIYFGCSKLKSRGAHSRQAGHEQQQEQEARRAGGGLGLSGGRVLELRRAEKRQAEEWAAGRGAAASPAQWAKGAQWDAVTEHHPALTPLRGTLPGVSDGIRLNGRAPDESNAAEPACSPALLPTPTSHRTPPHLLPEREFLERCEFRSRYAQWEEAAASSPTQRDLPPPSSHAEATQASTSPPNSSPPNRSNLSESSSGASDSGWLPLQDLLSDRRSGACGPQAGCEAPTLHELEARWYGAAASDGPTKSNGARADARPPKCASSRLSRLETAVLGERRTATLSAAGLPERLRAVGEVLREHGL